MEFDLYGRGYILRYMCKSLSEKWNILHKMIFDKDILCLLTQIVKYHFLKLERKNILCDPTNIYLKSLGWCDRRDFIKVMKIIVDRSGLDIPREIFFLSVNDYVDDVADDIVQIKSKLFSHRIMLPFYLICQYLPLEICSIIMNLFVTGKITIPSNQFIDSRSLFDLIDNKCDFKQFDVTFGQMCLNKINLKNSQFGMACNQIYFTYEKNLRVVYNTKLLEYAIEYFNGEIDYRILRIKIFDYALSSNIHELWKLIRFEDVNLFKISAFLLKYFFRICQENDEESFGTLTVGFRNLTGQSFSWTVRGEEFLKKFTSETLWIDLMECSKIYLYKSRYISGIWETIMEIAIKYQYIDIIKMFIYYRGCGDSSYVFYLFMIHSSNDLLKMIICQENNIFITNNIRVSMIHHSDGIYRNSFGINSHTFAYFWKTLSKYKILHRIKLDRYIIYHLIQILEYKDTFHVHNFDDKYIALSNETEHLPLLSDDDVKQYLEATKIIAERIDLKIPREIFCPDKNDNIVQIKLKIFSHRIILPFYLIRDSLPYALCSIIMNLFMLLNE